jgi:hypothetical protein
MISEPMVRLAQAMHLSCTYLLSGQSKMICEPMVHSIETMHLSCIKISYISELTEHSLEPPPLEVPSSASKTISKLMARLAQIVHLTCTNTNTISKLKEERLNMTHVTYEFYRVPPK